MRHTKSDAATLDLAAFDLCDTIDSLLSLYADHMAAPEEAQQIERHLPECADCRESLRWMQATRRVLSSRPVALPPAELRARIAVVIAASAEASAARPARAFFLRPAYAAAASISVLGALILGQSLLTAPQLKPPVPAPRLVAALPTATAPKTSGLVPTVPKIGRMHSVLLGVKPHPSLETRVAALPDETASPGQDEAAAAQPHPVRNVIRPAAAHGVPVTAKAIHKSAAAVAATRFLHPRQIEHTQLNLSPVLKHVEPLVATAPPVVSVGAPTVTPQEIPHPMEAAAQTGEGHFRPGEGHFQAASLLGSVQDYAVTHQSMLEHNLNRVGSTAIRGAVRTSAMTGLEGTTGKINAIYTP